MWHTGGWVEGLTNRLASGPHPLDSFARADELGGGGKSTTLHCWEDKAFF